MENTRLKFTSVKRWRNFGQVTKIFADENFYRRKFLPTKFLPLRYFVNFVNCVLLISSLEYRIINNNHKHWFVCYIRFFSVSVYLFNIHSLHSVYLPEHRYEFYHSNRYYCCDSLGCIHHVNCTFLQKTYNRRRWVEYRINRSSQWRCSGK